MREPPHAVLPIRGLSDGKSRLAAVLGPERRRLLNEWLMDRAFDTLEEYPGAAFTVVVSASAEVRERAARRGMWAIADPPSGLNGAVAKGIALARARGAGSAFVIPVDMPLLAASALRRLVEQVEDDPICLLVADRAGAGTNFLFQSPIRLAAFSYGAGSLARHRRLAAAAGLRVRTAHEEALAFDIDLPDDIAEWRRIRDRDGAAFLDTGREFLNGEQSDPAGRRASQPV